MHCFAVVSCATKPQEKQVVDEPFYTLHETKTTHHPYPLPNQSSIFVEWTFGDGTKKIVEGFRGWDVDHDGRFEMLEILSDKGEVEGWAFDFDGDGRVDQHKSAKTVDGQEASNELADQSKRKDVEKLIQLGH